MQCIHIVCTQWQSHPLDLASARMLRVSFLLLMVHGNTQYAYFSVTGIFSVTDMVPCCMDKRGFTVLIIVHIVTAED